MATPTPRSLPTKRSMESPPELLQAEKKTIMDDTLKPGENASAAE